MSEPEVVYGPLTGLIGTWLGDSGTDISPEPVEQTGNPYYETIVFEAGGSLQNGKVQTLAIVPYTQIVRRKSNEDVFHHQVGYWLWDAANKTIAQSVAIPRAVCCLAGATHDGDSKGRAVLTVRAELGHADWGIIQSPFMRDNASTTAYQYTATIEGDELTYSQTISLEIYGRPFEHTDDNVLKRVD